MSYKANSSNLPSERAALATGLFAKLADCVDRGDFGRAAASQKQLIRLGWAVAYRPFMRRKGVSR